MKTQTQKCGLLMAAVFALASSSIRAQDLYSPLMAGLERPYSQPVLHALADDGFSGSLSHSSSQILRQSHTVYTEPTAIMEYQNCGSQNCTDSQVCDESCRQEKPWWKRKTHKLNRKCYYNYHSYHPKALHPIVHPACQPGYGYYETCWRKIAPNPCFCSPDYAPAVQIEQVPNGMQVPGLKGEPLPPAPGYDR